MLLEKEVKMRSLMLASLLAVVMGVPAAAVTVQFTLEATGNTVVPTTGGSVPFHIVCTVSDGDNNGLALFACDILTDTGVTQPVDADPGAWSLSSENNLNSNFIDVQSEFFDGVAVDDDLIQVGAGQHTFVAWFFELGYGQASGHGAGQELASGYINVGPGDPATFTVQLGYCKATVIKADYDHLSPIWPAVDDVADEDLVLSGPVTIQRGQPAQKVAIEAVATMADHGTAGELGLSVDIAATASNDIRTESRDEGIHKLVIDCDGDVTLPDPPESFVESIVGDNSGDVTANVTSVTAVADIVTINLTALPDQDTYTVTLSADVIDGDRDFRIRALQGEVNNAGGGTGGAQVVNALDLSKVRLNFGADVTSGDNAKYDIISDGSVNALDLSRCRLQFTHEAP